MSDIRIEVPGGAYENDDVYENLLGYISNKSYLGGYGFTCASEYTVSEQFRMSETCSSYSGSRKMWHFFITFSARWSIQSLLQLANIISMGFSFQYQILFCVDTEPGNPHLHFGVNAFSYHPDSPVLSEKLMQNYLSQLQQFFQHNYPYLTVTLQFMGKGGKNV